jgi:hypothetical protein
VKVGGTTYISVPGKRNTRIEYCCQGIVYCNEALFLFLDDDKDRIDGEGKKKTRCVVKQKEKKKLEKRTKDNSYNSVYYCAKSCSLVASQHSSSSFFSCFFLLVLYETTINVAAYRNES